HAGQRFLLKVRIPLYRIDQVGNQVSPAFVNVLYLSPLRFHILFSGNEVVIRSGEQTVADDSAYDGSADDQYVFHSKGLLVSCRFSSENLAVVTAKGHGATL